VTDEGRLQASSPLAPTALEDGQAGAEAVRRPAGRDVVEGTVAALHAANDAHAKLLTIAEATPGAIFTYHEAPDGRRSFPYATPHLRDTHGIEPEDLMRDPSLLLARIHPDDADAVMASINESRRTMTMWHCQFRHNHPHKGEVWLEAYSSPIRDADGGVTWHGIVHDITSIKHAEIELLSARERAEAADRAKSEFLANMSHEIRTPMSAIMGYADMLSAHLQDPDDLHSLETIRSNGRYLLEIIDDILDLSQIEAGKMSLDLQRARPDRLVLDVQSLLNVRAAKKGLALEVEFDGRLPETIETDPTRLRQILINLIENAIKFTDKGEVKVVLRVVDGGSRLQIDVVDTGIGIPAATLPKLFRPFAQADSSATRRFRGSGLGLSICRALAKMLGGDILVTTQVGAGSTFTLTIDAGDLTGVPLVEPTSIDPPPVDRRRHVRSLACAVLVVDDRRDMRRLTQDMLEEAGAQVALAVDGRDALSRVADAAERGRPFDLILLDMQMPVLDGYATAVELRRRGFDEPIIALTAHAMKEDQRKCLACGCDDYLSKPLERERLVDTIAHYTQDVTAADLASRRATDASEVQGRPGYKVLIVDDNEDACAMMKKLLENAGCEVATATSGLAALAATGSFDTIVMDLGLPDISGAEVVARLNRRLELERCRFVCLSGRQLNEDDWRKLGFDHYIRKPARFEELERVLGPRAGPRGITNRPNGSETASRAARPR
jgi:PAS domain S-box-containing protein